MTESIISYNTAKLAYEKGIKSNYVIGKGYVRPIPPQECAYNQEGELIFNDDGITVGEGSDEVLFLAPTQSLLQKWLREVHKIDVFVVMEPLSDFYRVVVYNKKIENYKELTMYHSLYEDALEEGLVYSLNLLP